MGQGCNTALSTCAALDRALAASIPSDPQQLDAALQRFNADWLPEAHALQQLEYMAVCFDFFSGYLTLSSGWPCIILSHLEPCIAVRATCSGQSSESSKFNADWLPEAHALQQLKYMAVCFNSLSGCLILALAGDALCGTYPNS